MELEKPKEIDANYVIGMEMPKLSKADRLLRKFHSMKDHIFHMNRYGRCLYCEAGSKPVDPKLLKLFDTEIEEILRKGKK